MFSDTHCHLSGIHGRGGNILALIESMTARSFPFVLDIGTKNGDFSDRLSLVAESSPSRECPDFIHFSCGLWPDGSIIADRLSAVAELEADVVAMLAFSRHRNGSPGFAALGECGLDRYWNGTAASTRVSPSGATDAAGSTSSTRVPPADDGPGTEDIAGEEELFCMQLELAKKYSLPVIVHSRDAFDATLGCIRNSGRDRGVIHCFSYGKDEARAFLDRGWYLSFPGTITWPKKTADRERIADLVRYVPRDRLLLETDAPYLAPVPVRGTMNTPLLIEHTYECAAGILGMDTAALALVIAENARELFAVNRI